MIPTLFRIDRRYEEHAGTFTLQLNPPLGSDTTGFRPGQFNMLYAFGAGEVPISISGSPSDKNGLVHTFRTHGLVTLALARLGEGDSIGVRGPFGDGWPLEQIAGKDLLIVAGGLGLAPLRPVIYGVMEGILGQRKATLFYGARRPQEMLYRNEMSSWREKMELELSVDHAVAGWQGRVGVVTGPLAAVEIDVANSVVFLCGPEIMMRFCIRVLEEKGVPLSSIYLSMERNMKCATGHCGHCQWGPNFICKDGPVFCYGSVSRWFNIRAL
ncbi:FAD/NAD(P)-binding protein [Microbulbifer aggregans]|uniref:FAD/NAD(P)-binding protein n=1 Tax=Microbulbifer aggregans TaxID=1769779 RepID=UPI001CFDF8F8|nr:FAD/NAD(P)-binding protein [Microbulbifer aggregans]